jgi:hypothetical protein
MTQSVPAESSDGDFDGTIGDGGGGSGSSVSAAAAPIPGGGSKRAIGSSITQEPQLQKVLEVGLYTLNTIQLTSSVKAPGFNIFEPIE